MEPELPLFPARSLALFAGPTGVLPLLESLLAPLGPPLPALDMPVPPPPAAHAKLGIKINATVAKDEFHRVFPSSGDVEKDARQRVRGGDVPRSRHAGIISGLIAAAVFALIQATTPRGVRDVA